MNLTRFPVVVRVSLAFGAVALTLLLLVGAFAFGLARTSDEAERIRDRVDLQARTAQIQSLAQDNATAALMLLVSQSADLQAQLEKQIRERDEQMAAALKQVLGLVTGDAEAEALAAGAQKRHALSRAGVQRIAQLVKEGKQAEASFAADEEMIPMMAPLSAELKKLDQHARDGVQEAQATSARVSKRLEHLSLAVGAVAIVLSAFLGWSLSRSVTRPLAAALKFAQHLAEGDLSVRIQVHGNDEFAQMNAALNRMSEALVGLVAQVRRDAEQIATGSAQIAAGSADLSTRSEQQAANLEHTASSMEQLAATVRHNAETAMQASTLASQTREDAHESGRMMAEVVRTMDEIATGSRRMAEITGTIDGLAFQTNILALNAAVEAARAGEQGRGFAVVAAEVRSLAKRSAEAAREVRELLLASEAKIATGTQAVGAAGQTIRSTVGRVDRVSTLIGEIADATRQQTAGIGAVNEAVNALDETTQRNAALVQESAASADGLSERARHLVDVVANFKLEGSAA